MKKYWTLAIAALVIASMACSVASLTGNKATALPSTVLFADDFSDTGSGWDTVNGADGITDYKDGAYDIQVNTIGDKGNGMDMWANPGQNFTGDVRVEVDVTKLGGPDNNDIGVICRYNKDSDNYNFYYFLISSDGFVGIAKMVDSSSTMISGDQMESSDTVKSTGVNHIRADCIGHNLTLYVNGKKAASATDSTFTSGDVGLLAGTFDTPGTDVKFDNFMVTKP